MPKIQLEGVEYDVENLSEQSQLLIGKVQHVAERIKESQNMIAMLTRAKNAYIGDLKTEMISAKAGIVFEDD